MKVKFLTVDSLKNQLTHKAFSWIVSLSFLSLSSIPVFSQTTEQAVILQYHHVSESSPASTSLSFQSFYQHMEYLNENGFTVMPLEQVLRQLQEKTPLPSKTAVITFDDGYRSVYTEAYPLLKELNWPFTLFVSTGLIASNPNLYASWNEINEMASNGATIANHTVSHLHLLNWLSDENEEQWLQRISNEIIQAEEDIVTHTGQNHKILAYPYGEYDPNVQALLKSLGFVGIAQHSGPISANSDFTALPRFPFSGVYASMNTFPTKVNSLVFNVEQTFPLSPITSETMPTAQLSFQPNTYRLNQLACYNNGERIEAEVQGEIESGIYQVKSHINNRSRRFRYNCTAPGNSGRYHWYSIPWINPSISE